MKRDFELSYYIKCFFCGFAMCFPGLSGGTAAVFLGVYAKMTSLASGVFSNAKRVLPKLAGTAAAALCGFGAFLLTLGRLAKEHGEAFRVFAVCAAAVTCFVCLRCALSKHSYYPLRRVAAAMLSGAAALAAFEFTVMYLDITFRFSGVWLFVAGFLLSAALILPGISFTYMLMFLGLYEETLSRAAALDAAYLVVLGSGIVLGIITLSGIIDKSLMRHPAFGEFAVIGFSAATVVFMFVRR